jgi:predicted short-subunit dehydrogenase-like oxidoreductase (DUF2520 family)
VASVEPIGIVGAGAVAQAIGRSLALGGAPVAALAGRARDHAEQAARFIGHAVRPVPLHAIASLATRVLIAVSDDSITTVARDLADAGMRRGVALHTYGAKGAEALAPLRATGVACGMLHPLQTFPNPVLGLERIRRISFGLAGDREALDWAAEIVQLLDGRALHIPADRLVWYHAGAVLASNALIGTIDAATACLEMAGIEPAAGLRALEPLVRASVDNVMMVGPRAALTGPIARGDVQTVAAHVGALAEGPPSIAELYRGTARHLVRMSRARGLDEGVGLRLESTIASPTGG